VHALFAKLAVAQTADGVIFVQALLCPSRGLDVPFNHRQAKRIGNLTRKFRFACTRFALYKQRSFQCHGRIHRNREVICGNVILEYLGIFILFSTFFNALFLVLKPTNISIV